MQLAFRQADKNIGKDGIKLKDSNNLGKLIYVYLSFTYCHKLYSFE